MYKPDTNIFKCINDEEIKAFEDHSMLHISVINNNSSQLGSIKQMNLNDDMANNNYKKCVLRTPLPKDLKSFIECLHDMPFLLMDCPESLTYDKELDKCVSKTSLCDSNPCQSNGTCTITSQNEYECKCLKGFAGKNCEKEVDECFYNPCGKENTCNLLSPGSALSYYCECSKQELIGLNCENGLEKNPCLKSKDDKLFATKLDESVYIQCTGKKANIMPCPKSLVFSESAQRCDWHTETTIEN